ncbi:hypothetical protein HanPI659440_Chr00c10g0722631 [Helianthus annuus]|nr:hypothetical protein HanPI659440_Chr00c10g0722631 [Helianthus annuus]
MAAIVMKPATGDNDRCRSPASSGFCRVVIHVVHCDNTLITCSTGFRRLHERFSLVGGVGFSSTESPMVMSSSSIKTLKNLRCLKVQFIVFNSIVLPF